jgi:hypothetical protein
MKFNGYMRKLSKLPQLLANEDFKFLSFYFKTLIFANDKANRSMVESFTNSHLIRLYVDSPFKLDPFRPIAAREILLPLFRLSDKIKALIPKPQVLVGAQILWVNPGDNVAKHRDIKLARFMQRFICIIDAGSMEIKCFQGETANCLSLPIQDNDCFEFNNHVWHEVSNIGSKTSICLMLDFIEKDTHDVINTMDDAALNDFIKPSIMLEPGWEKLVIWDY